MSTDLACIIYADASSDQLRQLLHKNSNVTISSVQNNSIEVVRNVDSDPVKGQQFPDGFLYFQQRIEIFPIDSEVIVLESQIALVSMILNCLWVSKIPAVAACDYEDSLPNNGGYKCAEGYQRK
ncbi:hypothetical protein K9N68_15430 [Kovacikia minuta CCNUW1]|uniref:hypothetical protein n=1 Tax=Kovacikia minuta TaxID=2931930 RepID=UPI001CC9D0E8|nr:hypothetical protein [Kovacikia minuta]UBF29098.1 hypothetical protein K9N68_15430 [Kovacikia minuta CCNUW1]